MSISNIHHNHHSSIRWSASLTSTRGGRLRDLDEETKTTYSSGSLHVDERFRGEHVLLKRLGTATLVRNKTCTTGIVFVDKLVSQRANKMVLFRTINTWQMFDTHKHIYIYEHTQVHSTLSSPRIQGEPQLRCRGCTPK